MVALWEQLLAVLLAVMLDSVEVAVMAVLLVVRKESEMVDWMEPPWVVHSVECSVVHLGYLSVERMESHLVVHWGWKSVEYWVV